MSDGAIRRNGGGEEVRWGGVGVEWGGWEWRVNGERTGKGTYEWWILLWILWVSFVIFIIKSIINPPTK